MLGPASGFPVSIERRDLASTLSACNALLDARMRAFVRGEPPVERLYHMMAYHLGWLDRELRPCPADTGKRLRPALCFLACESAGGRAADALPGAVAVELVHNFSLVHDDIEDDSPLRRHRPTVWSLWGVPHGVNTGDGLLSMAHLALLEGWDVAGSADAVAVNRAAARLAAACAELCEGQFLDLDLRDAVGVDMDRYLAMIDRKTGALFACAMELGALLGGVTGSLVTELGRFGRALGRAFQMQDDLMGVWAAEVQTGKAASDVRDRKRGLPAVLAWEAASGPAFEELCRLYTGRDPMREDEVARATALFEELGVRERARRLTREHLAVARDALRRAAARPAGKALLGELIARIADRES
jgi:geranylgeranyl diphosphate synthase type I